MLNVHPSLLPRWRGAAPIERAIMAGDAETGVSIMRVTAGLDSGPGRAAARRSRSADDDYGSLSRAARGARRASCWCEALDLRARGRARVHRAGRRRGDLRGEDRAGRAPPRPGARRRSSSSAGSARSTRTSAPTSSSPAASGSASRGRAPSRRAARPGRSTRERRAAARLRRRARCSCSAVKPAGGRAMDARDYLRGHPLAASCAVSAAVTPARRVAYEVLRRTFEDGAWTDRAFAAAAAAHGARRPRAARRRSGSPTARCSARGTTDHSSACSPGAAAAGSTPRRSRRCGSASTSCSSPTTRRPRRGRPGGRARQAGDAPRRAPPGARAPRRLRQRAAAPRRRASATSCSPALDDSTAGGRGGRPLATRSGWREMWWEELGADEARLLMAAMNEPAETALRVNTLRADPAAVAADLRAAGVEVAGPERAGCSTRPTALVVDGRRRAGRRAGRRPASWSPQSRGSQAVVALLDPQPGERVLDLCAGPGIKTTAIAARIGDRGRGRLGRARPAARRARSSELVRARRARTCVRVEVADATEADLGSGYDRVLVDPPCSDLGTLASRPDARWRKSPERLRAPRRAAAPAARSAPRGRCAPGGTLVYSTCTISARENEAVAAALGEYAPRRRGRRPRRRASAARLAARRALPADCCPSATAPTGFFIARFRRARLMADERADPAARAARAAASRGCARPSSRAATAASTACAATSSSRGARTAASTRRSSGCPPTRTCSASIAATRC